MKTSALLTGLMLSLVGGSAHAIYQWDVPASDLENVECWIPGNCAPSTATIHMYKVSNPALTLTVPCTWFLDGFPPSYSFVADADDQINCNHGWVVDEMHATFTGPGFEYHLDIVPDPEVEEYSYLCGPMFPETFADRIPAGSDGCVIAPVIYDWSWANFPNGQVALTDDFVVPAEETLTIEPGIEVYALDGVQLLVQGPMEAIGTADQPIVFHGDNWDGIVFDTGADAELRHCTITDAVSADDGGAITVQGTGIARLYNCLVAGNSCVGNGAAGYVTDSGSLSVYNSTVSHNSGTLTGGVYLNGGAGLFESSMSLITYNEPANTDVMGAGFTNVTFTNIYPQNSDFPVGMVLPIWYCDPGYVNPAEMDFNISFWSLADPSQINCIIDVAIGADELDPDGTPADMGAFPFDQHNVLQPAANLTVEDRAGDQGGYVLLNFDASPNDGSTINPVTMYSIWVRYPEMGEDEWVSAGTVAAIAEPNMRYTVQVPTLDDQYEGHPNVHSFMVGTHSVHYPAPIASATATGFSVDNIAPAALAQVGDNGWGGTINENHVITINWAASPANDFAYYVLRTAMVDDVNQAVDTYVGPATSFEYSTPWAELVDNDTIYYWVTAVDEHENASPAVTGFEMYDDVDVQHQLPVAYELAQNFPNPFNPSTTINFALPQAGHAKLTVYNMMGNAVATLVNGQTAAGRYSVQFDGSKLASGVYFYKLEAQGFSDLKKMILVK